MVGRTKPQQISESAVVAGDSYTAEIQFLKEKNASLAKALSDSKISYSHMVTERDMLQQELFSLNLRYTKLLNFIKDIDMSARTCMNTIVSSSNYITNILRLTNTASVKFTNDNTRFTLKSSINNSEDRSPRLSHKTHAVKPMIDGHVIFRPTINLRRVNEMSQTEVQNHQISPDFNSSGSISHSSRSSDNNISNLNNASTFRTVHPLIEPLDESPSDELAREYMDDDDNMDDSEGMSAMNNGLDTVQEEQEDDLEETPRDILVNTSANSLSTPGNSSQVPLLSGVFRDVRVYLSPMQNIAQHADPRQHINTERGSGKTKTLSRRSSSLRLPRSSEKLSRSLSESRSTNFENNEENVTNLNNSSENSFDSVLQTSLLSSTRIATPKSTHSSVKPESPNWINVLKRHISSNSISDSNENLNNGDSSCSSKHLMVNECKFSPLLNNNRCSASSSVNTDYDPLEGPSTLLDSHGGECSQKSVFLEGVGLVSRSSVPSSPEDIGRKTRKKSHLNEGKNNVVHKVTQRKTIEKRKSIVSKKVAKVVLARMSFPSNTSGSFRNSLENSERSSSSESSKRRLSSKNLTNKDEQGSNSKRKLSSLKKKVSSNENSPLRKKSNKKSKKKSEQVIRKSSSERLSNNSSNQSQRSPQRPVRARRALQQLSFKEQSLKKKLRRSK